MVPFTEPSRCGSPAAAPVPAHYSRPRVLVGALAARAGRALGLARALRGRPPRARRLRGRGRAAVARRRRPAPGGSGRAPADAPVKDLRAFLARRGAPAARRRGEGRPACGVRGGGRAAARRRVGRRCGHDTRRGSGPRRPAPAREPTGRPARGRVRPRPRVRGRRRRGRLRGVPREEPRDARGHRAGAPPRVRTRKSFARVRGRVLRRGATVARRRGAAPLAGPVVVAGALLLEVGVRRTDGALVQLGGRGIALERSTPSARTRASESSRPRLDGRPAARV